MMKKTVILAAAVAALVSAQAFAGPGGSEFTTVYDQVSGWTNGVLGKTLAISSLLVGLGIGVLKQSVMAAVTGVAMALVAGFGPSVIDGVITAAVPIIASI